jgi:hypothetical protein
VTLANACAARTASFLKWIYGSLLRGIFEATHFADVDHKVVIADKQALRDLDGNLPPASIISTRQSSSLDAFRNHGQSGGKRTQGERNKRPGRVLTLSTTSEKGLRSLEDDVMVGRSPGTGSRISASAENRGSCPFSGGKLMVQHHTQSQPSLGFQALRLFMRNGQYVDI